MKTTFQKIKDFEPCSSGWKKLISFYNPNSLNQEISVKKILKSNGIKDAVWSLRAVDNQKNVLLFCADVAESVAYIYNNKYPNDNRVNDCISVIRRYVADKISADELNKTKCAAAAAVDAVAYAADAAHADAVAYAADAAHAAAADAVAYAADAAHAAADAVAYAADAADAAHAVAAVAVAVNAAAAVAAADYAAHTADAAYADKWKEIEKILLKYCEL